jgi:hypothetical protein
LGKIKTKKISFQLTIAFAVIATGVFLMSPALVYSSQPEPITRIDFSTGPCLGGCQTYSVSFFKNNCASLTGDSNVPWIGRFVSGIDFAKLAEVLDLLKVDTLHAQYPNGPGAWEGSGTTLRVFRGHKERTIVVHSSLDAPVNLYAMISAIEGITFGTDWQPLSSGGSPPPCIPSANS